MYKVPTSEKLFAVQRCALTQLAHTAGLYKGDFWIDRFRPLIDFFESIDSALEIRAQVIMSSPLQ